MYQQTHPSQVQDQFQSWLSQNPAGRRQIPHRGHENGLWKELLGCARMHGNSLSTSLVGSSELGSWDSSGEEKWFLTQVLGVLDPGEPRAEAKETYGGAIRMQQKLQIFKSALKGVCSQFWGLLCSGDCLSPGSLI